MLWIIPAFARSNRRAFLFCWNALLLSAECVEREAQSPVERRLSCPWSRHHPAPYLSAAGVCMNLLTSSLLISLITPIAHALRDDRIGHGKGCPSPKRPHIKSGFRGRKRVQSPHSCVDISTIGSVNRMPLLAAIASASLVPGTNTDICVAFPATATASAARNAPGIACRCMTASGPT